MLQVFESHAEVIGYDTFMLCSLPYLKQIAEKVKEKLGPDAVPMVRTELGVIFKTYDLELIITYSWLHRCLEHLPFFVRLFLPRVHTMPSKTSLKLDMMLSVWTGQCQQKMQG